MSSQETFPKCPASETASSLDHHEFARGFELIRERTNLIDRLVLWFRIFVDESLTAQSERFSVLSVGAGNGHFDLRAINILRSKLFSVDYDVIEPNPILLGQFLGNFKAGQHINVSLKARCCLFEEYATSRKYDLILFGNCLSHIQNRQLALAKALSMLNEEGQVVLITSTRAGVQDLRMNFSPAPIEHDQNVCLPGEIDTALASLGAEYTCDHLTSRVDVTECFEEHSSSGNLLLAFILGCRTQYLDAEVKADILNYLRSLCTEHAGRVFMPHSADVFRIFRVNTNCEQADKTRL